MLKKTEYYKIIFRRYVLQLKNTSKYVYFVTIEVCLCSMCFMIQTWSFICVMLFTFILYLNLCPTEPPAVLVLSVVLKCNSIRLVLEVRGIGAHTELNCNAPVSNTKWMIRLVLEQTEKNVVLYITYHLWRSLLTIAILRRSV